MMTIKDVLDVLTVLPAETPVVIEMPNGWICHSFSFVLRNSKGETVIKLPQSRKAFRYPPVSEFRQTSKGKN